MDTDIIVLKSLYEHVQTDTSGKSLYANSKDGRAYGKLAKALVESVQDKQGFYLWGKFEGNGRWINIYIGMAGYGKTTCLRARILEELKDERIFLWANNENNEKWLDKCRNYYPKMRRTYESHWKRAIKKSGSTHIVWVTTPDLRNADVKKIEADIIETMNPIANIKRPAPVSGFQKYTEKIISSFKYHIHLHRSEMF